MTMTRLDIRLYNIKYKNCLFAPSSRCALILMYARITKYIQEIFLIVITLGILIHT